MKAGMFNAVYADANGRPQIAHDLLAVGANGLTLWEPDPILMQPLPQGSDLLYLPGRSPLAIDPETEEVVVVEAEAGEATALAATLPVGYTRLLLPAAEDNGTGANLPLFGYTAVAAYGEELFVAAVETDNPEPWAPISRGRLGIDRLIARRSAEFPGNRVLGQLAHCARDYHCRTALNLFLRHGEAGLPSATSCNAACLGCISLQPAECCPAPQGRINFTPEPKELVELAVAHLEGAPQGIVSFGQGCEGEPLTVAPLLAEVIRSVRRQTARGTININTNGGRTSALTIMLEAGLDSVRISLFSGVASDYTAYHQPSDYTLDNVRESLCLAASSGCLVNLNLLVYPGYTDCRTQAEALIELCRTTGLRRLQLRNLNIDPRLMTPFLTDPEAPGVLEYIAIIRGALPGLLIGNYTHGRP